MGESAILELSGMVNEFQGCIARIPNLAKARFAGFVCCIHLQLSEKVIVYVVVRALFLCKERSANLSCKEDLGEYRLSVSIKLNQNPLRVEEHG